MCKVTVLGSAHAVPDLDHDNAHLLIQAGKTNVLVDCSSSPVQRLQKAGVALDDIGDIIFTHFHPDHVAGAPLFFMVMWLQGRQKPLQLYGLDVTLSKMHQNMQLYGYETWPGCYPMQYHPIPSENGTLVMENDDLKITSSPVKHLIPTIGIRADFKSAGKSMAYSCDTEPCEAVVELARGADILFHEAAGGLKGHSSPEQAAEIAQEAGVKTLYLIHYAYAHPELNEMVKRAQRIFSGPVILTYDFMTIELG
ncbi:MAG: MBL fold metallo-hydrolase [Anaerolineaceae bacterium]